MILLILGLALWYATHLLKPAMPARRAALAADYGESTVKGALAALSLLAVALMVIGYRQAAFVNVWIPPEWMVHLNNLLMLLAVALMAGAAPRSPIRRFTRHPMLNGVKTWATAHLLVNGDLASIVLFGGLLVWAVIAMIAINRRDGKPAQQYDTGAAAWARLAVGTVIAFGVIVAVHNWLGVWPLPA